MDLYHSSNIDLQYAYLEKFFPGLFASLYQPDSLQGACFFQLSPFDHYAPLESQPIKEEDLEKNEENGSTGDISSGNSINEEEILENANDFLGANEPPSQGMNEEAMQGQRANTKDYRNFLQDFRPIFADILDQKVGDSAYKYPLVKKLRKMVFRKEDVVDLLCGIKEFKPVWEEMFAQDTHIKMMLKKKWPYKKKYEYLARVHIFQKAFSKGKLLKVNEPIYTNIYQF